MEKPLLGRKDKEEKWKITWSAFGKELKKVSYMAVPMVAVTVSQYLLQVISVMMVGHLGKLDLSGIALGSSFANVTGFSFVFGIAGALETLCGQAYGAQQYQKLGTYTYCSIICLIPVCIPICILWIFMDKLLVLLGQDPEIAMVAGRYAICLIPALFACPFLQSFVRYFQCQSLIFPMFFSSSAAVCLHIPLCWTLLYKTKLGIIGAALSTGIAFWFNVILLGIYMRYSSSCEKSRALIFKDIFSCIKEFFSYGLPSAIMLCLEWWSSEILILLSGLLPDSMLETSVLSICLTIVSLHFFVPYGISAAASTRVSNELGAGNPQAARLSVIVAMVIAIIEPIIVATALFSCRHVFGKKIWKDELSRCVKELRKYRRYQHCLDIMDWMEKRNMQFSHVDHAIRLDLIAKTKGLGAAKDYLSALPPGAKNRLTYGALLNCYCNNLMKDEALTLFKKMDEVKLIKSALPFNNLMCLYMRLGQPEKVPELIDELKQRNIPRCRFTYIFWMQSYANLNDIEGVERVLEELSNDSEDKCTWTTYSNLAAIYVKAGQFEKAEACLKKLEKDKMPRQREAYHFLISLYAGTSNLAEVYRVWEALKRAYSTVTNLSYLIIVQALANLKDFEGLKKCFEEWESNYSVYDMRLATSTIRGYLSGDMHKEAELVLDNAMKRSKGPFTRARECFMVYFLKKRRFDLALRHMEAAVSEINDWSPSNPETTTAFFDYFMNKGDVDAAEEFCKILKNNNCLDSDAYHWLLRTYVAAGKVAPDMRKRLENDGIELSQDLQNLLVNVCPE